MSSALPVVSGQEAVTAFLAAGFAQVGQRGDTSALGNESIEVEGEILSPLPSDPRSPAGQVPFAPALLIRIPIQEAPAPARR